ncbi:MAG: electron transfer flavoprotein subunit alpha/FixB family protein [Bdellovibrionales bacterium]|nr:electron transfer flavoprotein subunit alpha/FixB family protein [Bdellovibrionales bacterium]
MAGNVLVFVEHADGKVKKTSLELLSEGFRVSTALGSQLNALMIGENASDITKQIDSYGVSEALLVHHTHLQNYSSESYAEVFAKAAEKANAEVVLVTANSMGKDFMPRLAAKLKTGLVSDCTSISVTDGILRAKRPMYSGKVIVDVTFSTKGLKLLTCRPNVFEITKNAPGDIKSSSLDMDVKAPKATLKELVVGAVGKADLTEAEVVVSAGRSIKSAENFSMIESLAEVLGAAVGASRAAVDAGFAPHSMQVGQTGKTVNPKLYIACGISGAIQHLAGMRTSKVIVAINTDPEAPIFQNCDYGIVGDMFEVVPMLTQEFKKLLAE